MKAKLLITAAATLAASVALAQGPGYGPGPGGGKGPGKGQAWTFSSENTRGWAMMSREERAEHRNRMLSFKSYDECVAYVEEHHKAMAARAKERGRAIPAVPRQNMCERMKQAGRFGS